MLGTHRIVWAAAVLGLVLLPPAARGQEARGETAWEAYVRAHPGAVDDETITPLERRILHSLTPEQAEAFLGGADPRALLLAGGESLAAMLAAPAGQELVYVPVDSCRLASSWHAGMPGAPFMANEVRNYLARGMDLSAQGGSATGCGIPAEAVAVAVQLRVFPAGGEGRLRAWASDAPEPATPLLDFEPTAEWVRFNSATVLSICVSGCPTGSEFRVRTVLASAHVRIDTVGYFRPLSGGPGSGLDADTLDGLDSTDFAAAGHTHDGGDIVSGTVAEPRIDDDIARDVEVLPIVLDGDGSGSTLDADLLDAREVTAFRSRAANVIQVAPGGGDFTTIGAALAAIGTTLPAATATNRYLIRVGPGTYTEQVTMKPFVDVAGAGEKVTRITSATAPTVAGASDAELRHLSVACTGGTSSVAIRNLNASPMISYVKADASGGTTESIAVLNDGTSAPVLDHVAAYAGAAATDIGVVNQNGAVAIIRNSSLAGGTAAVENRDTATAGVANTGLTGGAAVAGGAAQSSYMCVRAYVASTLAKLGATCTAPPVALDDGYDSLGNTLLEVTLDHAGVASTVNTTITEPSVIGDRSPAKTYRSVFENDTDADTPKSLLTAAVVPGSVTAGASVTMFSDGTFEYLPPAGFTGADTFDYTVTDDGGSSDTGTVTVNVASLLWYVDNTAGAGGSGRSDSRFDQLTDLGPAADAMGDLVFVFQGSGATTCGHNLLGNQLLIGQGLDLDANVLPALGGYQYAGTDDTVLVESAGRPTLSVGTLVDCVTVASGNTIRGLDFGSSAAGQHRIAGSAVGTLTINASSVASPGGAIQISTGGTLAVTFDSITSTSSSGAPAIDLTGVGGSFTVTNGAGTDTAISGADAGISVQGSSASFSFGDASVTTDATGGDGVNLGGVSANSAATFTFASLDVTSAAGDALFASSSGTLNVAGALNTLTATGGAALDVRSTKIENGGGGAATFDAVSSTSSASRGVNLSSLATGSKVTVSGATMVTNPADEGVFLSSAAAAAIDIQFTGATTIDNAAVNSGDEAIQIDRAGAGSDIDFGTVNVLNRRATGIFIDNAEGTVDFGTTTDANGQFTGGYGIRIEDSAAAFTFAAANLSNTNQTVATTDAGSDGVPDNEGDGDAIFLSNMTGSFTLNGGTIQDLETDGIDIRNSSNVTISGVTIDDIGTNSGNVNPTNDNGIFALNLGGTNLIRNGTISNFQAGGGAGQDDSGVKILNVGTGFTEIRVDGMTFDNNVTGALLGNRGFEFTGRGAVSGNIAITGSTFRELPGDGIGISNGNSSGSGTVDVVIANSTLSNPVIPPAGVFGGIQMGVVGTATLNVHLAGTTLQRLYPNNANNGMLGITTQEDGNLFLTLDDSDFFDSGMTGASDGRGGVFLTAGNFGTASDDPDNFDVMIFDSDFSNTDDEGIFIDVRGSALNAGNVGQVRIVDNRVGDDGAGGLLPVGNGGFDMAATLRIRNDAKTIHALVDGNRFRAQDDSTSDEIFDFDSEDSITANATMTSNFFTAAGGLSDPEFEATVEDSPATKCLDLRNNTAQGGTATFRLDNAAGGTFNANDSGNTGTVTTVGTIGSVGSCTLPSGKIIPTKGSVAQTATVSTAFTALGVTLLENDGDRAAGVTVTFTAPGSGASGTFPSGNTCVTNASGTCSVPFTANATAGAYEVTAGATVSGSAESAKFLLRNLP